MFMAVSSQKMNQYQKIKAIENAPRTPVDRMTGLASWWNRLRVQQKVWTILLVVMVPVVIALAFHATLINNLLSLQQRHDQLVNAQQQILILRRLAVDIEDAFRGYLLTGQDRFLVPLREAEPKLHATFARALEMAAGVPGVTEPLDTAMARLRQLLDSKHVLIRQVQQGYRAEVLQYVESGKGLALSDAVRDDLRSVENRLEDDLRLFETQESEVAQQTFSGLLIALLGGMGLGLLGARLLSRSITGPVVALERSVSQFGAEVNEPPVPAATATASCDEIGRLAQTFREMAGRIQQQLQELEALNATGHEINTIGPDGLEGVLRRITDRAAELFKADVCLLMLRNEQMRCWIVEAASGPWNDRVQKTVMLWEEFPVSVDAFETGKPAIAEDLSSDERPFVSRRNLIGQSMLAVPLLSQGVPFGVLVLLLDRKVSRESWNVRLAKGLADEAAIAIANARLYEAAHQKERGLETRLKQLEHLAETLAHDLKAPGERMEGLASMLRTEYAAALDQRAGRWVQLIEENGRDLITRVENILQVAKVGAQMDAVEAVDPMHVLEDVLKARETELEAARVRVHVESGFPLVACHRAYLRQVFDNLVSNATKFAMVANPKIRVTADLQGPRVLFTVSDNGPGIPPEHRHRVLEPFVRLKPQHTKGTGIGLAIVKRIVELYGGALWIEENVPTGCSVKFTLPLLADLARERQSLGSSEGSVEDSLVEPWSE
jgi:signal transduction histidine kinase/CHASE3 domain sensor protein